MKRRAFTSGMLAGAALPLLAPATLLAVARPRALRLYNPNTRERWRGAYHDGTALVAKAREELDWFLRDFHEKQETAMDPAVLDLMWRLAERYRRAGRGQVTLNVHSAYRTKITNDRLIPEGAARNSQHLKGKAVDLSVQGYGMQFLARHGISVANAAGGGLGTYWRGKFIHLDSGPSRRWWRRR